MNWHHYHIIMTYNPRSKIEQKLKDKLKYRKSATAWCCLSLIWKGLRGVSAKIEIHYRSLQPF